MNWITISICLFMCFGVLTITARAENQFLKNSQSELLKVERLINSDTVILENGKKIRLIGIKGFDAPRKSYKPTDQYGFPIQEDVSPLSSIEDQAYEFARDLLEGKKVFIEYDVKTFDSEGYVLGYLFFSDGTLVNGEILKNGFANLHIQPPNLKYADQLREAYREARHEKRGIHAE